MLKGIVKVSLIGVKLLKNTKLRIVWIIPNVFCYLMVIIFSIFVALNAEGLQEIKLTGHMGIYNDFSFLSIHFW